MDKKRNEGYYWIKINHHVNIELPTNEYDEWEVAFYKDGEGWYSIWDGGSFADDELLEINETELIPQLPPDKDFKFNWDEFYNYIVTYSPKKHGANDPRIILQDILYGIGIAIEPDNFKYFKGFRKFKKWLKDQIN